MRKIGSVFLALLLLLGLCGCGSGKKILGTWETVGYYDGDAMLEHFVHLDLYEEEIVLMDPGAVPYVQTFVFNADKSYTIACDTEKSIAMTKMYYRDALASFYENREGLETCYGVSFGVMDEASFYQFFAELYGVADVEALVDMFTESTVDPEYLAEGTENGTYRITPGRIYCTVDGEEKAQYIPYSLDGDVLVLSVYQGDVTYNRRNSE